MNFNLYRTQFRCIICFLLFFLTPLMANQTSANQIITLEDAVTIALEQNNTVKASHYGLKKAVWNRTNAWTQLFPTIDFTTRRTHIDDRTFAERDFRRYLPEPLRSEIPQTVYQTSFYSSLDLNVQLFNGVLINGISIANANVNMAQSNFKSAKENTIFLTINSYLAVLQTMELLELQKQNMNLALLNLEKADRLHEAGRLSDTELLQWKMEYQQYKISVVNYESQLRSVLTNLKHILNAHNQDFQISNMIPEQLLDESDKIMQMSEEEILSLIKIDEKKLVEVNANLSAAKQNEKISKLLYLNSYANFMPNLSLSYSHAWRENDTPELDDYSPKTLLLNLSVPLFSSFQRSTATRASYFDYKMSQENFDSQLQNTQYVLTETANRILNLKAQKELSQTNLEFSEANFKIQERQRERGLLSNIDYIDAQLKLKESITNNINTRYDLINAILELYYMLNKLETFNFGR